MMCVKTLEKWVHMDSYKRVSCIVVFSILLNLAGRYLAKFLELPVWFDFYGTLVSAYVLGPIPGGIVGFFSNAILNIGNPVYSVYGITNLVIGLIAGYGARKGYFNDIFHSLVLASLITISSVVISTPFNLMFFDGYNGNIWGNGVVEFALSQDIALVPASIIGEFYVDFVDKFILSLVMCLFIHYIRKRRGKEVIPLAFFKLKNISILLIPILLIGSLNYSIAANKEVDYSSYIQTVYSSTNGIPCGTVNDVAQSNDGILWMATYAGLYRYNGKDFRLMKDIESVKKVKCLYADEEGRLWIGTNDNGVSIIVKQDLVSVIDKSVGLPSSSVSSITQCSNGNYYIGNSEKLAIVTLDSGLKISKTFLSIKNVNHLAADKNDNIAAVTKNGELYILHNDQIVTHKKMPNGQGQYLSCAFDVDGTLLIGHSSNIIYKMNINLKDSALEDVGSYACGGLNGINNIKVIDGKRYICAENGIGYIDEAGVFKHIHTKNFNNSIDNMIIDYQGSLWFTSSRLGLLRISKSPFENMFIKSNLPEKVVNTIDKWNDNYYIGTDTGIYVVDANNWKMQGSPLYSIVGNTRIRCIKHDSSGNLWICTYGKGLIMIDSQGQVKSFTSSEGLNGDRLRTALELKNGSVAVAGNDGINFIKDGVITGGIGDKNGLGKAPIMCMIEQEDGSLLAGTDGSGIIIIKDGKISSKITNSQGLSSEVIIRMVRDTVGGGVYIVSSNGLNYMDKEGKITVFKNVPYYDNYDIIEGENNKLFLISSAGIYIFSREQLFSGKSLDYELLDTKAGMYSPLTVNAWNYMDDNGYVYLSSGNSVMRVNLNNYSHHFRSLRMLVDNVKLDGKWTTVDKNDEIYVPRDVDRIELFPEIVNYSIQDPYVSYYLEGIDSEPTIVRQSELSSVIYTNLPSGSHKFVLNILDNDKQTVLESVSCTINKEIKIYDLFIFKAYLIIVFILMVSWVTWFIIRSQLQRTIDLQRKQLELAQRQVKMADETVLAIARTVDAKDENTSQHSVRVAEYSVLIAKALGMSEAECKDLKRAAIVHDIGKIGIPDRVLNKPARLDDEEYAIMKSHVIKGAKILKDFTLVDHIIEGVLYHHERYDGSGYVHGLKGEEIPLFARIIGVADAFDAMTANRVYRKRMDMDYVRNEFIKGKNKQFDGNLVNILFSLIDSGIIDVNKIYEDALKKKGEQEV